ncbi:MAG: hypothetical protein DRN00_00790 [Thermoplasmata archaeon]|mgnify:CR=1 FL=1|nr:MAG: hypothetical protein DRN00_00790 [Thermoplasmata archaeon]
MKRGRKVKIARFEEMKWKEIEEMDKKKSIVFLPMGSLEEHGPHLPVGTDLFIAEEIVKEVAKLVKKEKLNPVLLPSIPVAPCSVTFDFPGTLSVDAKCIENMVYNISKSLALHDFKYLVICTYHMDPFFIKAIHKAIRKAQAKFDIRIAEPGSSFFYGKGDEDLHAGEQETSIMLYLYPHLVDPSYKSLSNFSFSFSIKDFRKTLRELGAINGYVGFPSKASIERGKELFEKIVYFYFENTLKLYNGEYSLSTPKFIKYLPLILQRR